MPLGGWLKNYFKANKKFGSNDRKQVAHICYCYYRLGNAFQNLNTEEKMLLALCLCSATSNMILQELKPEWNEIVQLSLREKIKRLGVREEVAQIFPFTEALSEEIDHSQFNESFLIQPDLFLRIRPGKEKTVIEKIQNASNNFSVEGHCITLPKSTKIDAVLLVDDEVVIQDAASQKVLDNLQKNQTIKNFQSWDCCAASGGKTILLHDIYPKAQLTVSDSRESILHNLKNRFKRAGINNYQSFVADLSSPQFSLNKKFDVIICDAPCSGSGTWSRTPEQLFYFKNEKIESYAALQKSIAFNACNFLKPRGFFVYITCSVFRKENEEVVEYIQAKSGLKLLSQEYIKGYDRKADTLYTALFTA
jgi:16S rRNA (cytosine967-C5)-methyltransferase